MFSQFRIKRKFPSNNKKTTASARSIQKDTPQLFFEMAEAEAEAEAIDPPTDYIVIHILGS